MEAAAAILGAIIGVFFGWALYGWLNGREAAKVQRFHEELDAVRRRRTGLDR